jgi:hypothetical protein
MTDTEPTFATITAVEESQEGKGAHLGIREAATASSRPSSFAHPDRPYSERFAAEPWTALCNVVVANMQATL